jgi:ubiquinone biosynthesis monooxygenase Coq7
MDLQARLKPGETIGDRIIKIDHAGEHGAICIYRAQLWVAKWRSPDMVAETTHFLAHEVRHRAIFGAELERRGRSRCKSYHLCGLGGLALGFLTGLAGKQAMLATTFAVEKVVLSHLAQQELALAERDPAAVRAIGQIIADEREHHDSAESQLESNSIWVGILKPIIAAATEAVIWLGMKL